MSTSTSAEDATGNDTGIVNCGPNVDSNVQSFTGGEELKAFAAKYSMGLAWVAMISVFVILAIFILWTMGYVTFGKSTVSSYSSSFVTPPKDPPQPTTSRFGNNPNWRMQAGDAGYGAGIDIPGSGRGLGFEGFNGNCPIHEGMRPRPGVSNFVEHNTVHPRPGVSNMEPQPHPAVLQQQQIRRQQENLEQQRVAEADAKARAQAELAKQEREARRAAYEAQNMESCNAKWDPMAIEEARVLTSVGSYQQRSPAMGTFNSVINPKSNVTLTDAQLEAIMQGGEPFSVDRFDQLPITNSQLTNKPLVRYQ